MSAHIRRGVAAGLVAGLMAGLFLLFVGAGPIEQAIVFERPHARGHHDELVSRDIQRVGLVGGLVLYGIVLGGVLGWIHALARGSQDRRSPWQRAWLLAGAGFVAVSLIPFLKYPADPPGIADDTTVGGRTLAYLALMTISIGALLGAWLLSSILRRRGLSSPQRHLLVGFAYLTLVLGAFALLPSAPDPGAFPADVLWSFRMISIAAHALLWASLGLVFGLGTLHAERSHEERPPKVTVRTGR